MLPEISLENSWPETLEAVDRLTNAAILYMNLTTADAKNADCLPIFFTHVVYRVGCILLMLARDTFVDKGIGQKLSIVKNLLLRADARWRLAGRSFLKGICCYIKD